MYTLYEEIEAGVRRCLKGTFENFARFTGTLVPTSFLTMPATLLKNSPLHRLFFGPGFLSRSFTITGLRRKGEGISLTSTSTRFTDT